MNNLWLFITDQAWSRTCFCMLRHKINTTPSPVMINQNGGPNGSNWQKYRKSKDRLYASELLDFSVLFQRDLHTGYDCILFLAIVKIFKVWITIMKDQVYFWLRDKSGRMWNELVDLPTVRSILFVRCCFLWKWRTTDSYGVKSMHTYVICTEISWCIFISAPILLWIGVFLINRLFL